MKVIFEAVLVREDGGEFDTQEFTTLSKARKGIKKMIDGKPYHDAYIRRFAYEDEEMTRVLSAENYGIESGVFPVGVAITRRA